MSFFKQFLFLALLTLVAMGGVVGYERYIAQQETGDKPQRGSRGPSAAQVVLITTSERTVERRIEAVGTTLAKQSVEIVPLTSGRITEIAFKPGDRVAKGAVLARLDDDIERADFAEAKARLTEAQTALERAHALSKSNTVSQASIEQLIAAEATARAQVDRARRRLADRSVRAPFAGHVGLRRVDLGARIDDGTMITTLDDLSKIEVEFALPETVFALVHRGLTAFADSVAFPGRRFEGLIETIDSRIDPASRSFKVRAEVPNADNTLPVGMFMHLAIVLDSHLAIMIPEEAVVVEGDASFVFVVVDGRAVRREVSLGTREPGSVEITNGLTTGESIVVRGIQRLRDGTPVNEAGVPDKEGGKPGKVGKPGKNGKPAPEPAGSAGGRKARPGSGSG